MKGKGRKMGGGLMLGASDGKGKEDNGMEGV